LGFVNGLGCLRNGKTVWNDALMQNANISETTNLILTFCSGQRHVIGRQDFTHVLYKYHHLFPARRILQPFSWRALRSAWTELRKDIIRSQSIFLHMTICSAETQRDNERLRRPK
jgi:hypothetical protein